MKNKKPKEQINFSEQEIEIRKKHKINLVICLIYAIVIELYFIGLNAIKTSMPVGNFNTYVKIFYMVLILMSVILFEIAYKKEKKSLVLVGIELIGLALHTLLIERSETSQVSILLTSCIWPIYYCLKAIIIQTKENRRRLRQISDIYEIVKEEKPIKKVAKKRKT